MIFALFGRDAGGSRAVESFSSNRAVVVLSTVSWSLSPRLRGIIGGHDREATSVPSSSPEPRPQPAAADGGIGGNCPEAMQPPHSSADRVSN